MIRPFFEGPGFLIINKPPGFYTQPPSFRQANKDKSNELIPLLEKQLQTTLRQVQRLDYETTGGLVVSTNKYTARMFHRNMQALNNNIRDDRHRSSNKGYTLTKRYIALVNKPVRSIYEQLPKTSDGWKLLETQRIDESNGSSKLLLSKVRTIDSCRPMHDKFPLMFELITGRKHQIRKQIKEVFGTTIVNDVKYGSQLEFPQYHNQIALHSCFLSLKVGLKRYQFDIPLEYGKDMWEYAGFSSGPWNEL
ncbi:BA75_03818T0 [Komagataella pastoris]|uniref:21S rRNA pseudouridine(2819) synthase n=1 Tax=Komagataella pastoris TaxID=4922 RepID=A0A1B2JFM2_PICPA|nr:BA75_03818T0 [Komagataella pastoris]